VHEKNEPSVYDFDKILQKEFEESFEDTKESTPKHQIINKSKSQENLTNKDFKKKHEFNEDKDKERLKTEVIKKILS